MLVSFSHFVPEAGHRHAGGEYVHRHIQVATRLTDVRCFVSSDFAPAAKESRAGVVIIARAPWSRTLPVRLLRRLGRAWNPASVGFDVRRSFRKSPELVGALLNAQVVEFQFMEQCWAIRWVRTVNPQVRTVAVVHDVVSQRLSRRLHSAHWALRPLLLLRLAHVRRYERSILNRASVVTVFSSKDGQLLQELGIDTPFEVVPPPLADVASQRTRAPARHHVLFVGAFDRRENADAAVWLLEHVWPEVAARVPDAQLNIVGANPTAAMTRAASGFRRVHIQGFVERLDDAYQQASVVVVPLHEGAGVKFKTVSAILHGVPLVATHVGMEGVDAPPGTVFVADDAQDFAAHVVASLLTNLEDRAAAARAWAQVEYSEGRFAERLRYVFGVGSPQSPAGLKAAGPSDSDSSTI